MDSFCSISLWKSRALATFPWSSQHWTKHSALFDLIKLPEDVDKRPYLLVMSTMDKINKGIFTCEECGPIHSVMLIYDNLLSGMWAHLKTTLAHCTESLYMLFGQPDARLRKKTLSEDKHYKNLFFYSWAQLRIIINARKLTLSIQEFFFESGQTFLSYMSQLTEKSHSMLISLPSRTNSKPYSHSVMS